MATAAYLRCSPATTEVSEEPIEGECKAVGDEEKGASTKLTATSWRCG